MRGRGVLVLSGSENRIPVDASLLLATETKRTAEQRAAVAADVCPCAVAFSWFGGGVVCVSGLVRLSGSGLWLAGSVTGCS